MNTECYETLVVLQIVYEEYAKYREGGAQHHNDCINWKLF